MAIAVSNNLTDYRSAEYVNGMRDYLSKLRADTSETAVKAAKDGLIRTGVLDPDGNPKDKIVSWE